LPTQFAADQPAGAIHSVWERLQAVTESLEQPRFVKNLPPEAESKMIYNSGGNYPISKISSNPVTVSVKFYIVNPEG